MGYGSIVFVVLIWCIIMVPVAVFISKVSKQKRQMATIDKLSAMLFPEGEVQKDKVVCHIMEMTSNRFTTDEVLDYYIKIKGLQMLDLNSFGDDDIRDYLMKPTRIRLKYNELVSFYEIYLNLPQAKGMDAAASSSNARSGRF